MKTPKRSITETPDQDELLRAWLWNRFDEICLEEALNGNEACSSLLEDVMRRRAERGWPPLEIPESLRRRLH
jgi:hypothetical protein